nr:hypothetical protein Q903MT_gene5027 [Picea sitchensis]
MKACTQDAHWRPPKGEGEDGKKKGGIASKGRRLNKIKGLLQFFSAYWRSAQAINCLVVSVFSVFDDQIKLL